jgi:hypothetical protein
MIGVGVGVGVCIYRWGQTFLKSIEMYKMFFFND